MLLELLNRYAFIWGFRFALFFVFRHKGEAWCLIAIISPLLRTTLKGLKLARRTSALFTSMRARLLNCVWRRPGGTLWSTNWRSIRYKYSTRSPLKFWRLYWGPWSYRAPGIPQSTPAYPGCCCCFLWVFAWRFHVISSWHR